MRYETAGESHGRALVAIVTGVPAGVPIDPDLIDADLRRRQSGYGRGGRMRIESDKALILSGVRFGATIGSPVALTVANRDWDNWTDVMSVTGESSERARVTAPRPGHADLAGVAKIGSSDCRDVLERASARETAARVAAGGVPRALLRCLGVEVGSYVESIGAESCGDAIDPGSVDALTIEASEVRCPDAEASVRMCEAIDSARENGESLGGVFVVYARGLVPGVGSYAEAGSRLDGRLAAAVMSVPAIKGVEIGDGFALASHVGSRAHDEITFESGKGILRPTNRAGGLEGGMTNGETLVVRAAMKPIPTLMQPLASVDLATLEPVDASKERSDVCAVPAAAVVAEAEVAFVLADAYLRKFGEDCLGDTVAALERYRERLPR